jgi:hypothetical protein
VAAATPGIEVEAEPVDALDVPPRLAGFRTIFTALHHFGPGDARAILAFAVRYGEGIAVVEGVSRTPAGLAILAAVPLAVWLLTPVIRPFRWSRLFWTYLVPVLPLAILHDGVVSVLRVYTPDDMLAMRPDPVTVPGCQLALRPAGPDDAHRDDGRHRHHEQRRGPFRAGSLRQRAVPQPVHPAAGHRRVDDERRHQLGHGYLHASP